jgi:iron complex outermembrane receptor protein
MNWKISTLISVASAIGLAQAAPAFAESGDAPVATSEPNSADIVVTARRVEERLQDVPISISVFNQQQLENRNVSNASDLATYTPSLQADNRFGSNNATFSIRGFRQDLRTSASVGIYFADVVAQRGGNGGVQAGDGAGPGSFFDLQNVQVLKGPQGTLFGRNTTGGAVLLVPNKPTDRLGGYLEGTYGNHGEYRLQSVINLPVNDTMRFRAGVDWHKRDGYLHNISGIGPKDFNDINYVAARASLVMDLTPELENYMIASYSHADENGPIAKAYQCAGTNMTYIVNFCQPQLARQAGQSFYTVQNGLPNPQSLNEQWQIINTTTWTASDSLTIKNIIAYGQLRSKVSSSLQGVFYVVPSSLTLFSGSTPVATVPTGAAAGSVLNYNASLANGATADQSNFVEELQLQGHTGDSALVWQAGAYFESSNPLGQSGTTNINQIVCTDIAAHQCVDVLAPFFRRPIGNLAMATVRTSFRNAALYAQGTYKLAEGLKLTTGIRYTWDKTSGSGQLQNFRLPATAGGTPPAFYPCSIGGATAADDAALVASGCQTRGATKSNAPTWVIGLDYTPVPDILLYAKYSRGYRQGAYSANAPVGYQTFGPEKIDAYEAGIKTSFHGIINGTFNLAGFYNDLYNQQVITAFADTTGGLSSTVVAVNVGKSRLYGLEVDTTLEPFRGFVIDASYAYLNSRIQSVDSSRFPATYGPTTGGVYPFYNLIRALATPGARFQLTPTNKLSVTGTYTLPVPESVGRVSISATYSYTDNYDYTTGIFGTVPSVELVNANLNWKGIAGTPVDLSIFATNLFNKKYYTSVNDNTSAVGQVSGLVGEPQMYGIRVRFNFGS